MLDLKSVRTERGFTQQQLADQIFCARTAIANIECGITRPSVAMAQALGKALGVNWWEFFEGGEDNGSNSVHGSGSGKTSEN
jgi:transcriptional regulator with XRE-family HTH domain